MASKKDMRRPDLGEHVDDHQVAFSRKVAQLGHIRLARTRAEFDSVLSQTGKSLDELRDYVETHPQLKRALYKYPHREGVAGTAAQFAWHVSDLMNRDRAYRRQTRVPVAASQVA